MKKLDVRCCCDPGKLLGWLEVDDELRSECTFPVLKFTARHWLGPVDGERVRTESLTLPICDLSLDAGPLHMKIRAVKADGVSVDTLRTVLGFVPAPAEGICSAHRIPKLGCPECFLRRRALA